MRRRDLIKIIACAATAWPLEARAQQIDRMRRIGILLGFVADDPRGQAALATLLQALQQLGWIDGRNVRIDYRLAGSNAEDLRKYAAELVTLGPDVLLGTGGSSSAALFQATRSSNNPQDPMSALGQKRTLVHVRVMSALPPKADIGTRSRNVRFVPKADM